MTKNELIKQTLKMTKLRRKSQILKVIELKVQKNHLSKDTKKKLHRAFLEAKWLYNSSLKDPFNISYKVKEVTIKVFNPLTKICDLDGQRELLVLSSQVKDAILTRLKRNIFRLSKIKNKGGKIGTLKPKNEVNSIPFMQYETTHRVRGNKIKLQNLPRLKVNGLHQIPKDAELANALLIRKPSGYYIKSVPTTQMYPKCQCLHKQGLDVRDYSCSCGYYHPSRDTKAALTSLTYWLYNLPPLEQRSLLGEDLSSISFYQLFQLVEKKQDTLMTQEAHLV